MDISVKAKRKRKGEIIITFLKMVIMKKMMKMKRIHQ